jgi:Arc-like DNA binding dprotein
VARKPTDTVKLQLRLEEGLRRRLEREARWRRRSMNAEIVSRLQESFDIPDQAQDIASEVSSEVSYDIDEMGVAIQKSLDGIRDEIRTVLARLDAAQPKDDGEKK